METKVPEIRKIYNPGDGEKKTIKFVYDRKRDMEESEDRVEAMKRWEKGQAAWENWRKEKNKDEWQSNHVVPMTFSVIETATSEIIEQSYYPLIGPRGKEDIPRARVMNHVYRYTWDVSDGDLTMHDLVQDALIGGTAVAQEYYWKDRRIIQSVSSGKSGKEKKTEREVAAYDDCYLENVRLPDFYVDDKARGFVGPFGARDCIRRYVMTYDDFKLFFAGDVWDEMGNAQYVRPGKGDTYYYEFFHPPVGMNPDRDVEVLWYWAVKPKDALVIVANDVLIKDSPIPFRHKQLPFGRLLDVKRTHNFYGKGEAEILESIQDESNIMRRMIIDRNHLDIDKMFLVSNRLSLSDEDLIARPHGMIPTDDVSAAKPVEYGDIPRSVELSLQHLEDDGTISTGINPRAQALPTAGSATEAAILKESTLKRIRKKIWLMRKEFLPQVARLRVANILQFYSQPRLEKIVGEQGTAEFEAEIQNLEGRGLLEKIDGNFYRKEYRQITMNGMGMDLDDKGIPRETSARGFTFFELKPDYFMPVSRGGYNITFDTQEGLVVSKALQQTKDLELFDRILPLAEMGIYDMKKIGDMILKSHDKDPSDFLPDEAQETNEDAQRQMLLDMAGMENKMMSQGSEVPPTPFASPLHTRMHIEFVNSDQVPTDPNSPIVKVFLDHITGELLAQDQRAGQAGAPGSLAGPEAGMGMMAGAGAQAPKRGGAFNGQLNKAGGVKKPANKVGDTLPALNMGGNRNLP